MGLKQQRSEWELFTSVNLVLWWRSERMRSLPVRAHKPLWCSDRVVRDFVERNPDQSPVPLPHMTQLSNRETFPLVLKTQCVSRKPMGRWKKFKRKDCQIIFKLPKRGVPLLGFLCNFKLHTTLSVCPVVSLSFLHGSASLPVSFSVCQSVFSHDRSPYVFGFAVMLPTPQPTDDVDIYFETPADDKEHGRFQRAKEQLEIRHHNRMERVS